MTDGSQQPGPGEPRPEDFAVPDTAGDTAARRRRFWLALIAVVAVVAMVATSFSFLLFSGGDSSDAPAEKPAPTPADSGGGIEAAPGPGAPDGEPADDEQAAQIKAVTEEFIDAYNVGDVEAMRATMCTEQAEALETAAVPTQKTVLDGLGHVFVDGDRATARADVGNEVAVEDAGDVLVLQEIVMDYRDDDGWKLC